MRHPPVHRHQLGRRVAVGKRAVAPGEARVARRRVAARIDQPADGQQVGRAFDARVGAAQANGADIQTQIGPRALDRARLLPPHVPTTPDE